MSIIQSWSQLENIGVQAGDFVGGLGREAARAVCGFYRDHPNSWVISPIGRGLLGSVCPRLGVPPAPGQNPKPPLPAGSYAFSVSYIILCSGSPPEQKTAGFFSCTGISWAQDIVDIFPVMNPGNDGFKVHIESSAPNAQTNQGNFWVSPNFSFSNGICSVDPQSIVITITDCGYVPPAQDVAPPDNQTTITVEVFNQADNSVTTNTYDLEIPITNNRFSFPTTVNIENTDIEMNLGGISINEVQNINPPPPRAPFSPSNRTRRPVVFNPNTNLPEGGGETEQADETEELERELGEFKWVLVTVTTLPLPKQRIQLHVNPSNNSYHAGYFYWYVSTPQGVHRYPEIPIRKERNAYEAPSEATGYGVYTIYNARVKIEEYSVEIT